VSIQTISSFETHLKGSPKKIVITAHTKPDADALGSSLALKHYLDAYGHKVSVIMPSEYPAFINWMPGNEQVMVYTKDKLGMCDQLVKKADYIFCLDFSALNRLDKMEEVIRNAKAEIVLIDHHLEPEDFAKYVLWSEKAAATAELIYEFIELMGDLDKITVPIAECMYAGIMTDTGSFRHSNTTENVHHIVANLIAKGADNAKIHRLVYDNNSLNRMRFLGFILSEKLTIIEGEQTAYIALPEKELKKFNSKNGDTEGIVNYALSIEGINFACIMVEKEGMIKMSFRSVNDIAVNQFAKDNFEGGGHKNAAGGRSMLSLEKTKEKFLALVPEFMKQYI